MAFVAMTVPAQAWGSRSQPKATSLLEASASTVAAGVAELNTALKVVGVQPCGAVGPPLLCAPTLTNQCQAPGLRS